MIAALGALAAVWALSSLWLPFGWDHGVFASVSDVIRRGGVPYRDVWEVKGPLALYLYASAQNLFGPQMWSVRAVDLLALGASTFAGYRLLRTFEGPAVAVFGVATMVLAFASFGNWYTAQPDGWAAHALVVLVATLALPKLTALRVIGAGALIGLLTLIKPTYAIYLLLVAAALGSTPELPRRLRAAVGAGVAFAVPIAVAAAWFAAHGALSALIDLHLRFNAERLASDPNLQMGIPKLVMLTLSILTSYPDVAPAVPGAALGIALALVQRRRAGLLLLLWPLLALATVAAQRKFLFHNYSLHALYPPLLLAAALGLGWLWRNGAALLAPARTLVAASALLLGYQVAKVPAAEVGNWLHLVAGRQSLEEYRASFEGPLPWLSGQTPDDAFGFSVTRDLRFARVVAERTRPGDEVFVWADPLVNYLSDRPALTPITAPEAFTVWGLPERRARYRADLVAGVLARRAAIIAIPQMALRPGGPAEFSVLTSFPELIAALDQTYRRTVAFEDLELYEPR